MKLSHFILSMVQGLVQMFQNLTNKRVGEYFAYIQRTLNLPCFYFLFLSSLQIIKKFLLMYSTKE